MANVSIQLNWLVFIFLGLKEGKNFLFTLLLLFLQKVGGAIKPHIEKLDLLALDVNGLHKDVAIISSENLLLLQKTRMMMS